jgi:HK97 family phage major capsid protein
MDRNADYKALRDAIDETARAWLEFKELNDKQLENKADGKLVSDLEEKIERINAAIGDTEKRRAKIEASFEADRARIEELEALMATGGSVKNTKVLEEHRDAFFTFLRGGGGRGYEFENLRKAEAKYRSMLPEEKQVNLASAAAGEALVPEIISTQIEKLELKLSPVRRLITFIPVMSTDFKQVVDIGGTASGWLAETGTRSVTDSPTLRVRTPKWGELYARPQATDWAVMDIPRAEAWLAESVADEFISAEGIAVISGNGTAKPTGLLNTTPLATADWASPLRSAEALEVVAAPSPDDITEHLLMLIYKLNSRYRTGAAFVMNSNTLGLVRRAKASDGHYLWQPSMIAGEPTTIDGHPFEVWEDMDDVGASPLGYPIMFGNFRRGYLAAQRSDIRLLVDPYTTIGLISYWFRRRESGIILNNDAIKVATR